MPDMVAAALRGAVDASMRRQSCALGAAAETNQTLHAVLGALESRPGWYVGAGAVAQTVWNLLHGRAPDEGIVDYDVVYHDADLSEDAEQAAAAALAAAVGDIGVRLDVKNQARVHLWYERRFGRRIAAHASAEAATATWPSTASCVALRRDGAGAVDVVAPFGLRDLFAMRVRPNRVIVPRAVYEQKAARWSARWPLLRVAPWEEQATDDVCPSA